MVEQEIRAPLPAEIVTEILKRLPDRSLMQCKSVCKEWHTLISDPSFASSRSRLGTWRLGMLDQSCSSEISSPRRRCNIEISLRRCNIEISRRSGSNNITLCTYDSAANQGRLRVELLYHHDHRRPCLAGSCNGILYIINPNYEAILLNPAIRSSTWIPQPDNLRLELRLLGSIATGLGYDHTTDDYKAVILIANYWSNIAISIFSLRRKLWKMNKVGELEDDDHLHAAMCIFRRRLPFAFGEAIPWSDHWCGTTVSGSPHWTGRRSNGTHAVIRFDVVREKFVDMGLPPAHQQVFEFGELDGRLCVTFKGQNAAATLEVWSYISKTEFIGSWIKWFSLTPKIPFRSLKPVAAEGLIVREEEGGGLGGGQVLMVLDKTNSLIKFNINDNTREVICVDLPYGYVHYVETPTCPW